MDGAGRLLIAPVLRQHAGLAEVRVGTVETNLGWRLTDGISWVKRKISTNSQLPKRYRAAADCLYKMVGKTRGYCWMKPLMG